MNNLNGAVGWAASKKTFTLNNNLTELQKRTISAEEKPIMWTGWDKWGTWLASQFCWMDIYSSGRTNTGSHSGLPTLFLCLILFNWFEVSSWRKVWYMNPLYDLPGFHLRWRLLFWRVRLRTQFRFEVMDRMFSMHLFGYKMCCWRWCIPDD